MDTEIEVIENNIKAVIDDFWDIDFKSNYVKFRRKKGEIYLSMDFRKDDVEVRGRFEIEGREFKFSPTRCDFGNVSIENLTISGYPGQTAFEYGDPNIKLLRPNCAMLNPRPTFIRR